MPSSAADSRERPPSDDLYAILGVAPGADEAAIRAAWRARAKQHHPDIAHDPAAEDRMRRINLAWSWLGSPERRWEYDRARIGQPGAPLVPGGRPPGGRRDHRPGPQWAASAPRSLVLALGGVLAIALLVVAVVGLGAINGGHPAPAPTLAARATTYVYTYSPTPEPTPPPTETPTPGPTAAPTPAPTPAPTSTESALQTPEPSATEAASPAVETPPVESPAGDTQPPFDTPPPFATAPPFDTPPPFATAPPEEARPLTMPASDAPPECRTASPTALRLDADVDGDGVLDSIFFLGPCPDLSSSRAPSRVLGPYVYASGGTPTWHLLPGVGPLAPGLTAISGFVGQVLPAAAGTSDLGVELLAADGHTSAVAVYRISGGSVKAFWDSARDGLTWQDATFAFGPTPAGASPNEGAILEVESGAAGRRTRQLWRWVLAGDTLTLQLRRTDPIP